MSQVANNQESRIINSWSFMAFKQNYEKLQRAHFKNEESGENFSKLAFRDKAGNYCFVGFSQNLGELSNEEIKQEADSLRIVQLKVDDDTLERRKQAGVQLETYKVCKGSDAFEQWEEIDI